ncbi:CSP6 family protein [Megaselia abdita]
MKLSLAFLALACVFGIISAQKSGYTTKYDNVDVDSILSNKRVLDNYIKCLMDKGACTPEGRELKKILPDALSSDCSKCTEVQKRNSNKVFSFLRDRRPGEWNILLTKYDPKGVYRQKFESGF